MSCMPIKLSASTPEWILGGTGLRVGDLGADRESLSVAGDFETGPQKWVAADPARVKRDNPPDPER